jgi:serine/threonine protein kinase
MAYIAEGSYGCVLHHIPVNEKVIEVLPLPFNNQDDNKFVSKIYSNTVELQYEWENAKIIMNIDRKQKYFVYPFIKSSVATKELTNRNSSALKCSVFLDPKKNKGTTIMLKMPFAGISLLSYFRHNPLNIKELMTLLLPVFKGLSKLSKAHYVHQDIKVDNIMLDSKLTRIIDFGSLIHFDDVFDKKKNNFLSSDNWLHPPEYLIDTRTSADFLKMLKIKIHETDTFTLDEAIIPKFFTYDEYDKLFKFQNNKSPSKIDIYSLGISLVYLSQFMNYQGEDQIILSKYRAMIKKMIMPNVSKRASPQVAYNMALKILSPIIP